MRKLLVNIGVIVIMICSTALLILAVMDNVSPKPTMSNHWVAYMISAYGYLCMVLNIKLIKASFQAGREREAKLKFDKSIQQLRMIEQHEEEFEEPDYEWLSDVERGR